MGDLTLFQQAGMPTAENFKAGIQQARAQTPSVSGGVQYLKMNQVGSPFEGQLTYGVEGTEVEEGSEWVVNTLGLEHGFLLQDGGSVLGEQFTSILSPLPRPDEMRPAQGSQAWRQAYKAQAVCVSGEDVGVVVEFGGSSGGWIKLFKQVILPAIEVQIDEDADRLFPAIVWEVGGYDSGKQKKHIYEAHAEVIRWLSNAELAEIAGGNDAGGAAAPTPEPEAESEEQEQEETPAPAPRRSARRQRQRRSGSA